LRLLAHLFFMQVGAVVQVTLLLALAEMAAGVPDVQTQVQMSALVLAMESLVLPILVAVQVSVE
jgi:hypothetical protein